MEDLVVQALGAVDSLDAVMALQRVRRVIKGHGEDFIVVFRFSFSGVNQFKRWQRAGISFPPPPLCH